MIFRSRLLILLPFVSLVACKGGGGSSPAPPVPAWPKFRHDNSNTGLANGPALTVQPVGLRLAVDENPTPGPVTASPIIALDGTVYAVSEGGYFVAVTAAGVRKWKTKSCEVCPTGDQDLGRLIASPAVYTHTVTTTTTTLMLASASSKDESASGRIYIFQDAGDHAVCTACGQPKDSDPQITLASFVSSPTFTVHSVTGNLTGFVIGAAIKRGDNPAGGKLYSFNLDGSLSWQFPASNDLPDPITSAPALLANSIYVIDDGGVVHKVNQDGVGIRDSIAVGSTVDPDVAFAPSVIAAGTSVYANSVDGKIIAFDADDLSVGLRQDLGSAILQGSMVLGSQPAIDPTPTATMNTPTKTPTRSPTAVGTAADLGTATPTPTPSRTPTASPTVTTALGSSTLYAVAKDGSIEILASDSLELVPNGDSTAVVDGPVYGSPALTTDGYLVFANGNGTVYTINGATLQPFGTAFCLSQSSSGSPTPGASTPTPTPIDEACDVSVHSSVAIATDGTIWVGADNGSLYRLGIK